MWYPEIKGLQFGPRLIPKLHERYQEFTLLVKKNYGIEVNKENISCPQLNVSALKKNKQQNNNVGVNSLNYIFDNNNNNLNFINNNRNQAVPEIFNYLGNNIISNRMNNNNNNNNYMNFKNKSNVGNINFIQMNNYMLPPGINASIPPIFPLNNGQIFPDISNLNMNNNPPLKDLSAINPDMKNNIFFQRAQQNNILGGNYIPFNMNYNNNQNYQQYLNMMFPNSTK